MCVVWLLLVLLHATVLVLRGRGILTERVVTHPTTLSPFFPRFSLWQVKVKPLMRSWSLPLVEKELCVPYRSRFTSLTMYYSISLVCNYCKLSFLAHILRIIYDSLYMAVWSIHLISQMVCSHGHTERLITICIIWARKLSLQ